MWFQQKTVSPANRLLKVVTVTGAGYLKSVVTGEELALEPNQALTVGDGLKITKGEAKIFLHGKAKNFVSPDWAYIAAPFDTENEGAVRSESLPDGPPGGGDRGFAPSFQTPYVDSAVWPERFVLRWDEFPVRKQVWVRLLTGRDTVIWPPRGSEAILSASVKPSKGEKAISPPDTEKKTREWDVKELRAILQAAQRQNDVLPLKLQWSEEAKFPEVLEPPRKPRNGKTEGLIALTLLSSARTRKLQTELDAVRRDYDPLTQYLREVRLFYAAGLVAETADAYVAAARNAPGRPDVWNKAATFLIACGQAERANQVKRKPLSSR